MRLEVIQFLRGIGAYAIVFGHLMLVEATMVAESGLPGQPLMPAPLQLYIIIDLFFLLSGFIMVYISHEMPRGARTFGEFLLARVARIYPLWWLMAGIMALAYFAMLGTPWQPEDIAPWGLDGPAFLIKSLFLIPQPALPVLSVGWTLIYEVYFYIVFSLLLLLPKRYFAPSLLVWAALVLTGALFGLAGPTPSSFTVLIFHPHALEFIAGAFLALLYLKGFRFGRSIAFGVGAVVFIATIILVPTPTPFMLEWGRILISTLPAALLIYGAAVASENLRPGFWRTSFRRLGDWSYAIYLFHIIALQAVRVAFPILAGTLEQAGLPPVLVNLFRPGSEGIGDSLMLIFVSYTLVTLVSAPCFYLFERPIINATNHARKLFRRKKTPPAASAET